MYRFYKGNANLVREQVTKVIKDNLVLDGLDLKVNSAKDFVLMNPRVKNKPYLVVFLTNYTQNTNRSKESVLIEYTFTCETYIDYQELSGSKPSVTYNLIDQINTIIYNNRDLLSTEDFEVYIVNLGNVMFDKISMNGNMKWFGKSTFTLTCGFK